MASFPLAPYPPRDYINSEAPRPQGGVSCSILVKREGGEWMKLTCVKRCRVIGFLANIKCPRCFKAEPYGDEQNDCECRLTASSDLGLRWE
jgi:hypothetical protein